MGGREKEGEEETGPERERGKVGKERGGGGTDRYWESEIERRSRQREREGEEEEQTEKERERMRQKERMR